MIPTKNERQLERIHLREMKGYVPGAQPGDDAIKLNSNENPFPPSPEVMSTLAGITHRALQRYPDPLANEFREAVARLHRLDRDEVIATNGGDELLRLALATFVDPGQSVGVVTPSYGVYSVMSAIHQAPLSCVPLTDDWDLAPDTAARWNSDGAPLALITNPHAPSGALFSLATIDRFAAEFRGVLLIDEAYVDFVDPDFKHDATPLIAKHSNVLLLRTMSKGYGLAGLRLAYGLGQAGLLRPMLEKTKDSYNVDVVAQALGRAALLDQAYASISWKHVRQERIRVARVLEDLRFQVVPSQTNFLMVSPPPDVRLDAASLYQELQKRGIYVRWFFEDRLTGCLRISMGTVNENNALLTRIGNLMES